MVALAFARPYVVPFTWQVKQTPEALLEFAKSVFSAYPLRSGCWQLAIKNKVTRAAGTRIPHFVILTPQALAIQRFLIGFASENI